jgi:hypothetical protein
VAVMRDSSDTVRSDRWIATPRKKT